ncbi:class I SAM-dependent methyltransferase [Faecalibaculum rodentium]|uniref:class I SAM-dependent methyltransferase n=1 Tax=Faecalibaculum rodentium TaxID=1702221 RepID=UPI0025A588F8|nr:class I SAM-dependent methyltransferase [Faecalibaculum rodentium]
MDEVSRTLYIPLYGKAHVSRNGIILSDPTAETLWYQAQIRLAGKSRSRWLAYYLAMRAVVYDAWLREQIRQNPDAVVLHLGCGLDSRSRRLGHPPIQWHDIDFPDVI